ncbi:uncharacterized protein LOC135494709 isoform X4 [Lineus longissimus]|uniref:uncharacterized protein LOC135494709 isoform X4 n=1 Tax=Lineus longissimus TaxID=88925 RepID=UPI00315DED6B
MARCLALILATILATVQARPDDEIATEEYVFKELPPNVDAPAHLVIRDTFKGKVRFVESSEFRIHVNVTTPTVKDLSTIKVDFSNNFDSALLQIYQVVPTEYDIIPYVIAAILGACIIALIGAIVFVKWWDQNRRPFIKTVDMRTEHEMYRSRSLRDNHWRSRPIQIVDAHNASRGNRGPAPIFHLASPDGLVPYYIQTHTVPAGIENFTAPQSDGATVHHKTESDNEDDRKIRPNLMLDLDLEMQSRAKKKKKRKPRPQDTDEFVSSEEENVGRQIVRPPGRNIALSSRKGASDEGSGAESLDLRLNPNMAGHVELLTTSDSNNTNSFESVGEKKRRMKNGRKEGDPFFPLDGDFSETDTNGEHEEDPFDEDDLDRVLSKARPPTEVTMKRITGEFEPLEALEELSSGSGDDTEFPPPPEFPSPPPPLSMCETLPLQRKSSMKRASDRSPTKEEGKKEKRVVWQMEAANKSNQCDFDPVTGKYTGCHQGTYPGSGGAGCSPGPGSSVARRCYAEESRSLDGCSRKKPGYCEPEVFVLGSQPRSLECNRNSNGTISSSSTSSVVTVINNEPGFKRSPSNSSNGNKSSSPTGSSGCKGSNCSGTGNGNGKPVMPPKRSPPGVTVSGRDSPARGGPVTAPRVGPATAPRPVTAPVPPPGSSGRGKPLVPKRNPDTTLSHNTPPASPLTSPSRRNPGPPLTAKNLSELNGGRHPDHDHDDCSAQDMAFSSNPGDDSGVGSSNGDTDTSSGQRSTERIPRTVGTGSAAGGVAAKKHFMMTFTVFGLLGLIGGVYSQLITQPEITITVYAPRGIIKSGSEVYSNVEKPSQVDTSDWHKTTQIVWYEVKDAYLPNPEKFRKTCINTRCNQGCDVRTGECLCPSGMVPDKKTPSSCIDLNECSSNRAHRCSPDAVCRNDPKKPGTYDCTCKSGFYGDGETCKKLPEGVVVQVKKRSADDPHDFEFANGHSHDCHTPCEKGWYETEDCKDGKQRKVCSPCTKGCPPESFITRSCGRKNDIACTACAARCGVNEYEHSPCSGKSNRLCKDLSKLKSPGGTNNVKYEDMMKVRDVKSKAFTFIGGNNSTITLDRGSGYQIRIHLSKLNLSPEYIAVNHSKYNDNEAFKGDTQIKSEYCPYPMPEMYDLGVLVHHNVTTKSTLNVCPNGEDCALETGYYMDPYTSCTTFKVYGRLPNFRSRGTIPCSRANQMTDIFNVSPELKKTEMLLVDRVASAESYIAKISNSTQCDKLRISCQACSDQCGRMIQSKPPSSSCAITPDESDNGYSPRLEYCYTCCATDNCTNLCNGYYAKDCKPMRCISGNIAEFQLTPLYPVKKKNKFHCHIQPKQGQVVYELGYSLIKGGVVVANFSTSRIQDGPYIKEGIDQHNFLNIHFGTKIDPQPNLVEGYSGERRLKTGYYDDSGSPIGSAAISSGKLKVKPLVPFGINSQNWGQFECNSTVMSKLVIANSSPFRAIDTLNVEFLGIGKYRILNASEPPFIFFTIPKAVSILETFYKKASVLRESLSGRILIEDNNWLMKVYGEVDKCPGLFRATVRDKAYPSVILYDQEVAVNCPYKFNIQFNIPADMKVPINKTFIIEIKDTLGKAQVTLFRPAEEPRTPIRVDMADERLEPVFPMRFPSKVLAALVITIGVLLCLLVAGQVTKPKHIKQKNNTFKKSHLVFLVLYVVYKTAYSLTVTLTVVFFICRAISVNPIKTMQQYYRHADQIVLRQYDEIADMRSFVDKELERQNAMVDHTKRQCEDQMKAMHKIFEQAMHSIPMKSAQTRIQLALSTAAVQHTRRMVQNLTLTLRTFREEFNRYADEMVFNLIRDIRQTYKDVEKNRWLSAARMIHDSVRQTRRNRGKSLIRPFMDWVGLQTELTHLSADLKMRSNIPMPNVNDFPIPFVQKPQFQFTPVKPSDVRLPHNIWLLEMENETLSYISQTESLPSARQMSDLSIVNINLILAVLLVIDFLWLLHRIARTFDCSKEILYGYPVEFDCRGKLEVDQNSSSQTHCVGKCLNSVKRTVLLTVKSEFLPKMVGTCFAVFMILLFLGHSEKLVTLDTLEKLGYFDTLVTPLSTNHRIANTRVSSNADRINNVDLRFYERSVDARLQHYQTLLQTHNRLHCEDESKLCDQFCKWSGDTRVCDKWSYETVTAKLSGCQLPRIIPTLYGKFEEYAYIAKYRLQSAKYVNAVRELLFYICCIVLTYILALGVLDLFGYVMWLFLRRFHMLRQQRAYMTDEVSPVPRPS